MSGGPGLSFTEVLLTSQIDSTALTNTVTATSILPPAARYWLPAGFFSQIGKTIKLIAKGRISATAASVNLTFDVRLGPATPSIIVWNGGVIATPAFVKTNVSFSLEVLLTCRSIGNSTLATLIGMAKADSESFPGGSATAGIVGTSLLPATAPAVGTGFDSTVANVIDLFATWGTAAAGNSIQTHQFILESLN